LVPTDIYSKDLRIRYPSIQELLENFRDDIIHVASASRLLLAPTITHSDEVNCNLVSRLVGGGERLTANFWVEDIVAVVRAKVGNLRRYEVPCAVDVRRMPPLRRYVDMGLAEIRNGVLVVRRDAVTDTPLGRAVAKTVSCLSTRPTPVKKVAECAGMDVAKTAFVVSLLRVLYPATLEIFGGYSADSVFAQYGVGAKLPAREMWDEITKLAERGIVVPNPALIRGGRPTVVRSRAAKYSIPPILAAVDYRDAVVLDVGSGFGTKGAATIRWGARHVILLDIDETILRARGNGLLIDRIVGDAHMLPIRSRGVDVAIFWNVYNFLHRPEEAVAEIKRVAKRAVAFSVYNALSGRYVDYRQFLDTASKWGRVKAVRRLGDSQYQAVVEL
jgi:SAM-dependent methyltransferase